MTCSEIWGGIGTIDQDVATKGVQASIFSKAAGSVCGGDIHYLSYCTYDMLTRLVVADVSGHGETVTMLSSWVYDSLKAQINSLAGDQILSELNRKICARGFEAITTAAVLTYDSSRNVLYFCYAGHPPAIVWRVGDTWRRLEILEEQTASNLPLGVRASGVYEQGRVALSAGDRLVVFTDGLLEAEDSHGEDFGEQRLFDVLEGGEGLSISSLKHAILGSLLHHTHGIPLTDDITILAAEVR